MSTEEPEPPEYQCSCGYVQLTPDACENCGEVWVAHNRCMKCSYEWHDIPGGHTKCPKCTHLYVKWMNYPIRKPNWCRVCKVGFK